MVVVDNLFSQAISNEKSNIIIVDFDTLPQYEERIERTNILFKVPRYFFRCKYNSIKISDCTFEYVINLFNYVPGIIQSKDRQMLVFLNDPELFVGASELDWKKSRRRGYRNTDYDDFSEIEVYSSKMAKNLFNADSLFVWERMPERTENLFVRDTVDFRMKFIERKDRNYRIENELFWQYYPYCKVMLIKKNGVGLIFAYIYFTERGIKRENKYIRALRKMFWFP